MNDENVDSISEKIIFTSHEVCLSSYVETFKVFREDNLKHKKNSYLC